MQTHNLINRNQERRYVITVVGLRFIMSQHPEQIKIDELKALRKRDIEQLWNEISKLHSKVLRIAYLPYMDETSRLMVRGSAGALGLFYVGALKNKAGKKFLSLKTADIRQLEDLGYT